MKRLYEALTEYGSMDIYPAHMPGHKGNISEGFLKEALRYDITEIDGFDNLHDAQGIILESERYAASLYGADETHFLTGGSTCGILSAITSTAPGGRIIIERNCHISVYNAVNEGRLNCSYVYPEYLKTAGFSGGLTCESAEEALNKDPDASALVIVSPTYEGVCSDIAGIAGICHEKGKLLIVDSAHGAHFGFCDSLPQNAVRAGADIVIHSVHKTLPSPTQTALIHINGSLADRERIRRRLKIYQSSSPSYLLMAGTDMCMGIIGEKGEGLFAAFDTRLKDLDDSLKALKNLKYISRDSIKEEEGVYDFDPGKLIISTKGTGISGRDLYDMLRREYRIQPEMASDTYCLMILTIMDMDEGFKRIKNALICIDEKISRKKTDNAQSEDKGFPINSLYGKKAEQVMPPYKALDAVGRKASLKDAAGMISGTYISLYPPGIPLIIPGERISRELTEGLREAMDSGLTVQGLTEDKKITVI